MTDATAVTRHYDRADLTRNVAAILADLGFADTGVTYEDLSALDQFHSRGLRATIDMAMVVAPKAGEHVLDIGAGLGGPSRYLAATFDCDVEGIDLSPSYVELARYLAERTALSNKVHYRVGDALKLPFPDASFDIAWTQHVAMNISDRAGLYREVARVLKPSGRFAAYDVVAGPSGPVHYPVPWSNGPETSFLLTPAEFRAELERQGFAVLSWIDRTEESIAWSLARANATPRPEETALTLSVAMGPEFTAMSRNFLHNMQGHRVAILEAILVRL